MSIRVYFDTSLLRASFGKMAGNSFTRIKAIQDQGRQIQLTFYKVLTYSTVSVHFRRCGYHLACVDGKLSGVSCFVQLQVLILKYVIIYIKNNNMGQLWSAVIFVRLLLFKIRAYNGSLSPNSVLIIISNMIVMDLRQIYFNSICKQLDKLYDLIIQNSGISMSTLGNIKQTKLFFVYFDSISI